MTTERRPTRTRVVVVVEDDRPIGELLTSIINDEADYAAIHILRPAEALDLLKTIVPDLLVLDVGLPGMSGIELYDKIREDPRLRDVPVLFETAASHENRAEFTRRGIDAVIQKPFEIDELVRRVHQLAPVH